jgi:beta-lactamase class A
MIESDNAAADRLVRQVGGAAAIQATLDRKGLRGILAGGEERDLQSKIAGLETWRDSYGLGNTFKAARARLSPAARDAALAAYLDQPADGARPLAVAQALAALKRGELLKPGSTALMIGLMAQSTTGPLRLKGGLPVGWSLAHKTGTGQDWRSASVGINDVGLMTAPDGRAYAIAVMIRRTAKPVPDRLAFMQGLASAVVRHWELETGGMARSPSLGPPVAVELPEQGRLRWAR